MTESLVVLALWAAFGASHMALSSGAWRPRLVAALGERGFLGVYSLVAFAFFVPLVWYYFDHKHAGPWLWSVAVTPPWRFAYHGLMGVAFVLMACGLVQPSPASLTPGRTEARGVLRWTRHPLFMGAGLFGLLHLVPNGALSDVVFFGGFPVFAVLGCAHQDRRKLAGGDPDFRRFHAETPFLPFTGSGTLQGLRELPLAGVALGVGLTVLLRVFHRPWFGP